jgi:hypothetical protein
MSTSESDRAASAWEPPTRNHDPQHIAFARECYAAGYEAGATDLGRLWDIARLRAEVARLGAELEVYERHFERFRVDLAKAIRERDAVCRYAAGFLTGEPELILANALTVAGYVLALLPSAIDPANPPLHPDLQGRRMTRCQSDDDGYCGWPDCPQNRDLEPGATGRHCPLDVEEGENG